MARHDLLAVEPADWAAVTATRALTQKLPSQADALVGGWGAAGWPVIVRRIARGDPPGALPVGLPLPPDLDKLRVALSVSENVRWRLVPRLTLVDVRPAAPEAWHATIDTVLLLGAALGLDPGVFGALLWQSVTGLTYLNQASDLDLLWTVVDPAVVPPLLDGLTRIDAVAPMRIDGEVVTLRGAVNWKELAAAHRGEAAVVLVKTAMRAGFAAADDLFASDALRCP